jgi:histidinol-phosphate aminotransferase
MEHLVRDCFRSGGYVFAEKPDGTRKDPTTSRIARLASNENPEAPSPAAIDNGITALRQANRYPDERVDILVTALKSFYGDYSFVTGVGMDGVIETLIRTLVNPGEKVAISTPTFSYYRLAAMAQSAVVAPVHRDADFSVDAKKLITAAKNSKITFLCSPNNPTGNATPVPVIEEILNGISGVLFLDCAYVEFSGMDYLPLLKRHENLVIGRTFSKAYSLAGLRIGYAFVPAWLQHPYNRAGTPFTVNSVSAGAAAAALGDRDHAPRYVQHVQNWRKRYTEEVKYPVLPSRANFVMVDVAPLNGDAMVTALAAKGVLVRSCRSFSGLADHYIRVSIGEDWENDLFIQVINGL